MYHLYRHNRGRGITLSHSSLAVWPHVIYCDNDNSMCYYIVGDNLTSCPSWFSPRFTVHLNYFHTPDDNVMPFAPKAAKLTLRYVFFLKGIGLGQRVRLGPSIYLIPYIALPISSLKQSKHWLIISIDPGNIISVNFSLYKRIIL